MYGQDNLLTQDVLFVDKRSWIFSRDGAHIIDLFLQILCLTTNIRGSFAEDMFKRSLYVIIRDDLLEGFVGKGYNRMRDGVGNGLGKCPLHDDMTFIGFVMEEFSHRSEQKAKKGF